MCPHIGNVTDTHYYRDISWINAKHTIPRRKIHYVYRFMATSIVSEKGKFVLHVHLWGENLKTALRRVLERIRRLTRISWLILDEEFLTSAHH